MPYQYWWPNSWTMTSSGTPLLGPGHQDVPDPQALIGILDARYSALEGAAPDRALLGLALHELQQELEGLAGWDGKLAKESAARLPSRWEGGQRLRSPHAGTRSQGRGTPLHGICRGRASD
jgi:hypothetical protein